MGEKKSRINQAHAPPFRRSSSARLPRKNLLSISTNYSSANLFSDLWLKSETITSIPQIRQERARRKTSPSCPLFRVMNSVTLIRKTGEERRNVLLKRVAVDFVGQEAGFGSRLDVVVEIVDVKTLASHYPTLLNDALENGGIGLRDTELEGAETMVETLVHRVTELAGGAEHIVPMNIADVAEQIDVIFLAETLH